MDTKKYAAFVRVAELGNLTRAAEELGLTQSAVSHILADLEHELGLRLLHRSRSGARLTPDGEHLMPHIRQILEAESRLREAAAQRTGHAAGTVRIGTFTSVAVHWLPGMMQAFSAENPLVDFRLLNGDYHDVRQWLQDGSVDVAFVTLPLEQKCTCVPLLEDPLLAILPPDHALAAQRACSVEDVAREPFISLLESSAHDAHRALDHAGVRPNVKYTTKDDYAIIAMVSQGMGVSIMPALLLEGQTENIAVRSIVPPASRTIALATPAGDAAPAAARAFAAFAEKWVREKYGK